MKGFDSHHPSVGYYFIWRLSLDESFAQVQTETFTVLAVCQWFNVLNCRSETKSALNFNIIKNYWLLSNILHFHVIYTVPIPLTEFQVFVDGIMGDGWLDSCYHR